MVINNQLIENSIIMIIIMITFIDPMTDYRSRVAAHLNT